MSAESRQASWPVASRSLRMNKRRLSGPLGIALRLNCVFGYRRSETGDGRLSFLFLGNGAAVARPRLRLSHGVTREPGVRQAQLGRRQACTAHTTSQLLPPRPRGLPMETHASAPGAHRERARRLHGRRSSHKLLRNEMRPSEATAVDPHAALTMLSLDSSTEAARSAALRPLGREG